MPSPRTLINGAGSAELLSKRLLASCLAVHLMPAPALPPDENARLAALGRYRVMDTPAEAAFDELTRQAKEICGVPMALISLVDGKRQWFKSRVGLSLTETPREHSFCSHALLTPDEPLVVPDATLDPRFADNPLVTGDAHLRFYAGMPLRSPEGQPLGRSAC